MLMQRGPVILSHFVRSPCCQAWFTNHCIMCECPEERMPWPLLRLHCSQVKLQFLCEWFQSTAWFPATENDTLLAVARWTAALTPVLKLRCRWQTDVRMELQVKLPLPCAVLCRAVLSCACCAVLCSALLQSVPCHRVP